MVVVTDEETAEPESLEVMKDLKNFPGLSYPGTYSKAPNIQQQPSIEGQEEVMHSLGPFLSLPCHFGVCIPSPLCHRQNLRRPQECQELY